MGRNATEQGPTCASGGMSCPVKEGGKGSAGRVGGHLVEVPSEKGMPWSLRKAERATLTFSGSSCAGNPTRTMRRHAAIQAAAEHPVRHLLVCRTVRKLPARQALHKRGASTVAQSGGQARPTRWQPQSQWLIPPLAGAGGRAPSQARSRRRCPPWGTTASASKWSRPPVRTRLLHRAGRHIGRVKQPRAVADLTAAMQVATSADGAPWECCRDLSGVT